MTDVLRGRLSMLYAAMKFETARHSNSSIEIKGFTNLAQQLSRLDSVAGNQVATATSDRADRFCRRKTNIPGTESAAYPRYHILEVAPASAPDAGLIACAVTLAIFRASAS